jgi:hypothetical protein
MNISESPAASKIVPPGMEAHLTKWSYYNRYPSEQREFNLHKILRAIDTNVILSRLTEADYCKN